jgi:FkbM family methyltransferase
MTFVCRLTRKVALEPLSWWLRRQPITRDCSKLESIVIRCARGVRVFGRRRRYQTRYGFSIIGDVKDVVTREIFLRGYWEAGVSSVLTRLLQPGDHVFDVGANIGYDTLLAACCVGAGGEIVAFEPSPSTRASLERNIAANFFSQCRVRGEAVSDTSGTVEFNAVVDEHTGLSSMLPIDAPCQRITVPAIRLDDAWIHGSPLKVVKIDVEGAEHRVLAGMKTILQQARPHVIVEMARQRLYDQGVRIEELVTNVLDEGYRVGVIAPDSHRGQVSPLTNLSQLPDTFDALFSPIEREQELAA